MEERRDGDCHDNCDGVTVTVSEETAMGDCEGNYVVTRTFTACMLVATAWLCRL